MVDERGTDKAARHECNGKALVLWPLLLGVQHRLCQAVGRSVVWVLRSYSGALRLSHVFTLCQTAAAMASLRPPLHTHPYSAPQGRRTGTARRHRPTQWGRDSSFPAVVIPPLSLTLITWWPKVKRWCEF